MLLLMEEIFIKTKTLIMKIKIGNNYYSLTSKEVNIKGIIMVVLATIITLILVFIRQELQQMILYMSGAIFLGLKIMWVADKITNWYIAKKKTPPNDMYSNFTWDDPDINLDKGK